MHTKRLPILLLLLVSLASGACASVSTVQPSAQEKGLKNYKRAYIEALPNDEFQIYQALMFELTDMGMQIVGTPFKEPLDTDLVVKYSFDAGWDFTKYLKAFRLQYVDAVTSRVIASTSYRSTGIWLGVRDRRLESAFNDLRSKHGYPPTPQFQ
jgi:hypothetical protein